MSIPNNKPDQIRLFNESEELINPATEEKQDEIITELKLKADLTETQPVSAVSLPLPTGASTEAKQDDIIAKMPTLDNNGGVPVNVQYGVPIEYTKQTASGDTWLLQKGQLNKLRLRPQIMNEHAESSRNIQGVVASGNIVGQIFKASQDNINGINLTLESAAGADFDDFESYADDAALQAVWVTSDEDAELETTNVYEGTQSMKLTAHRNNGNTWKRTFVSTDFTGFTGEFWMYSNKEYKDVKMEVIIEDSSGNISYQSLVQPDKNQWYKYVMAVDTMIGDATPADLTDIIKIGYRVKKEKRDGYVILDDLISVPGPGEVEVKLWDMGTSIPVSATTALDDGTQYTKLGDLGITGVQASSVSVQLLGGKRMYQLNHFVAGTSLEIPTNELLNVDNYYAITIHYVDTDVSVYGPNEAWDDYYVNGYGFTAPDESTAITAMGSQKDIQFVIFSTQDVYMDEFSQFLDEAPNGESLETIYVEDNNMRRTDVLISGIKGLQVVVKEIDRPWFMGKGFKFEAEYSDDISDSVTSANIIIQYYFIPPIVHG